MAFEAELITDYDLLIRIVFAYIAAVCTYFVVGYWLIIDIYDVDRRLAFPIDVKNPILRNWSIAFKVADSAPFPITLVSLMLYRSVLHPDGPISYFLDMNIPDIGAFSDVGQLMGIFSINIVYMLVLNRAPLNWRITHYRREVMKQIKEINNTVKEEMYLIKGRVNAGVGKKSPYLKKHWDLLDYQMGRQEEFTDQMIRITVPSSMKSATIQIVAFTIVSLLF